MGKIETMQVSEKKEQQPKEPKKPSRRSMLPQLFVSLTVAFGSMIVGFASAYTSPALASMSKEESSLHPNLNQKSWIGSLLPLFAVLGGIIGGPLIGGLGRKTTLQITGFPFIASFLLIALAQNITLVMVGRGLMGLSVGVSTLVYPIYLGEAIEAKYRGILGLFPTTLGNTGVLLSYTAGMFLNWSNLAYLGAILPIPFIICAFIIPETPRWYASKGQLKKSLQALQWLRGKEEVTDEFHEIEASQNKKTKKLAFKEIITKGYMKPLIICLFLMLFQQMSGINAIIFYSVDIFKESGSKMDSNIQSIILGVVNVISTTAATLLIDRLGRKILLYLSSFTMIITLVLLGFYFRAKRYSDQAETPVINNYFTLDHKFKLSELGWIPLACLVVYIVGFSIGYGPIPWLMMGEILPSRIKGVGASIVTAFNWACSFVVTKTFAAMTVILGSHGTFWLYGMFCIMAVIFIKFFVPETKGKSLEDIERMYLTQKDDNSNSNNTRKSPYQQRKINDAIDKREQTVSTGTNEKIDTISQITDCRQRENTSKYKKTKQKNGKNGHPQENYSTSSATPQTCHTFSKSEEDILRWLAKNVHNFENITPKNCENDRENKE